MFTRSVLSSEGKPKPCNANTDGAAADVARKDKEETNLEYSRSRRCSFVVVAFETGGRWNEGAAKFAEELNFVKSRASPYRLRAADVLSW